MALWDLIPELEALRRDEDGGNLHLEALAPGVDPRTLEVSVVQGTLTLRGEKPGLAQVSTDAYHRNERAAGRFTRTIDLPAPVDENKVRAEYKDGLLLVTPPKAEAAKAKQI